MKLICENNSVDSSRRAADVVVRLINQKPDATVGFATGSSPLELYSELICRYRRGEVSFKRVRAINLDEYVSLPAIHEQSYAFFMRKKLFEKIDILKENTYIPNGVAHNLRDECLRYDGILNSLGPIDLQILGIGHNGHIAFNEPSEAFSKSTSLVELSASTVKANSRFFASPSDIPTWALTMGIGSIMKARSILLLAFGEEKSAILEKALFGPVTPYVPASILQFYTGELTLVTDDAAFSKTKNLITKG